MQSYYLHYEVTSDRQFTPRPHPGVSPVNGISRLTECNSMHRTQIVHYIILPCHVMQLRATSTQRYLFSYSVCPERVDTCTAKFTYVYMWLIPRNWCSLEYDTCKLQPKHDIAFLKNIKYHLQTTIYRIAGNS